MSRRSLDTLPQLLTPCPLAAGFREPVSHCSACGRDVLDLSACTREEAAALLSTAEPPCVRFAVRDGRPVFSEVARGVGLAVLVGGAVQLGSWLAASPAPGWTTPRAAQPAPRRPPAKPAAELEVMGGIVSPIDNSKPPPAASAAQPALQLGGVPSGGRWR